MASDYTREWIQFFRGCGIPDDIAARYGLIFNENRIQKNMLLDLNKEYLRDMGITVMGDIIAILRHARVVHDKYIREQILSDPEEIPIETLKIRNSTPMKRMLEHYTRKNDPTKFNVPHEKVEICIENETATVNVPKNLAHRVGVQSKVKQRIEAPSMRSDSLSAGPLEVPVPKVRRVLPENEGHYTIKMPSGTTERSKKLLEKVKLKQNKTVFDRLGESSVSSTSDVSTTSDTTIQISKVPNNKDKNTLSVFSRLGDKSPLVTSTSSLNTVKLPDQLPYKGILKTTAVKKKVQLPSSSTMRADNELNLSHANNTKLKKINMVKERLGSGPKTNQSPQLDGCLKLITCQGNSTSEEKVGSLQGRTLLKSLKSLSTETEESLHEKKNVLDGLSRFRSETLKSNVTSTTQFPNVDRGVKRRLDDAETPISQASDVTQSKKVRFGTTTHRLIPGNDANPNRARIDFHRPAVLTDGYGKLEVKTLTLKSGVRIGPLNSDRQILSLKDRIGPEYGRITIDLNRKGPVRFNSVIKKVPGTVHDRLG